MMSKNLVKNYNKISSTIINWYDENGRDLPWRAKGDEIIDPYKVWVSEIMLQQTTVTTVLPYFCRFMNLWPSINELSRASITDIMKLWSGLGYYNRAKNLYNCAKEISNNLNNKLPENFDDLIKLPGIGEYTAAAISSIAFNKRAVVVDGNIKRVVSRIFLIKDPVNKSQKKIYKFMDKITPNKRCGDFAQAMMDLGSMICKPSTPHCKICPLNKICSANKYNLSNELPVKTIKSKKKMIKGFVYLIQKNNKFLFYTRPLGTILGGTVSLPINNWQDYGDEDDKFLNLISGKIIGSVIHEFSHFSLNLKVVSYKVKSGECLKFSKKYFWKNKDEMGDLALSSLIKKVLLKGKLIL
tara:strand:+ start:815 stop:1879 length:1065 start_codon:yes stop_codon:yes gene_type:complete